MNKNWYAAFIAFTVGIIAIIILLLFVKPVLNTSQGALSLVKDLVSITLPIASFAVGTYYARRAILIQEEERRKKPILNLLIDNETLIPDSQRGIREVVFCYSSEKGARVLCVIPLLIWNSGPLSAHNVHVRVSFPINISAYGTEIDTKRVLGDLEGSGFRRKSYMFENTWIVDYTIPEITPGTPSQRGGVRIDELVDATYSSAVEFDVHAVTKDKVPVQARARLALLSRVNVSVSGTDIKPLSNFFVVKSYDTKDEKEIAKRIMQERKASLGEKLRRLSAGEKDVAAKIPDLFRKAIIVIPELEKTARIKDHSHFTALYVEQPKKSKRGTYNPAAKDGVYEIDLKKLMSEDT